MLGAEDDPSDDGLARLRERLLATQRAAERLVANIELGESNAPPGRPAETENPRRPPPAGYAVPEPGPAPGTLDELAALVRMVRALVPDELSRELAELARELLLLVRALVDWLVGRLERERAQPVEVTDIPIA